MQIFVSNLPNTYSDEELRALFTPHGTVRSANIARDKKSDEPQGYGFVDMPVKSEARAAIEALRGKTLTDKPMLVRALKPGDDFHDHAVALQGGARAGAKMTGKPFQGNVGVKAGGSVRRSGKRGS